MEKWMWLVVGAVTGSVANTVIHRLPRSQSWTRGRSACFSCGHRLPWRDLLPIVSFVALRGKCRYCHSPIPWRYLAVEIFLGLSFVVINGRLWSYNSLILSAILWTTVVIAAMDWESMWVSDWLVGLWLVLVLLSMDYRLVTMNFLGAAVAVSLIGGIWVISKGKAMGFGDVEIAAVLGLWLGWPRVASALWISFVAGAVVGCWLLVFGRARMKSKIAFGPFLILSSWAAYLVQLVYVLPF